MILLKEGDWLGYTVFWTSIPDEIGLIHSGKEQEVLADTYKEAAHLVLHQLKKSYPTVTFLVYKIVHHPLA